MAISVGSAQDVAGIQYNTGDIQAVYRAQQKAKARTGRGGAGAAEFDMPEPEEEGGKDVSLKDKKAESRGKAKQQQTVVKMGAAKELPDFNQFAKSAAFDRFLEMIRRMRRTKNFDNLRGILEKSFEDPALQHGAIVAAIQYLNQQGEGGSDLKQYLEELAIELMQRRGPEIRAGYNVSNVALEYAGTLKEAGVEPLRNFYKDIVFRDFNLLAIFRMLMKHSPIGGDKKKKKRTWDRVTFDPKEGQGRGGNGQHQEDEEDDMPEGPDGLRRLQKTCAFMMDALAAELKSNRPSLESSHLKATLDGIYSAESLINVYRDVLGLLTKCHDEYDPAILVAPSRLMLEMLDYVEAETISDDAFQDMSQHFNVPPLWLRIYFLTQLYQIVWAIPTKLYPDIENRNRILNVLQASIDAEVAHETQLS